MTCLQRLAPFMVRVENRGTTQSRPKTTATFWKFDYGRAGLSKQAPLVVTRPIGAVTFSITLPMF
jgi:hypothetical protein